MLIMPEPTLKKNNFANLRQTETCRLRDVSRYRDIYDGSLNTQLIRKASVKVFYGIRMTLT